MIKVNVTTRYKEKVVETLSEPARNVDEAYAGLFAASVGASEYFGGFSPEYGTIDVVMTLEDPPSIGASEKAEAAAIPSDPLN